MWKNKQVNTLNILHELCILSRKLQQMPKHLVLKILYFKSPSGFSSPRRLSFDRAEQRNVEEMGEDSKATQQL